MCSYCYSFCCFFFFFFFFFNDTATTEIYTLSLHDALPISLAPRTAQSKTTVPAEGAIRRMSAVAAVTGHPVASGAKKDRKSTRLNSSHLVISYAVFCLKKKKRTIYGIA